MDAVPGLLGEVQQLDVVGGDLPADRLVRLPEKLEVRKERQRDLPPGQLEAALGVDDIWQQKQAAQG